MTKDGRLLYVRQGKITLLMWPAYCSATFGELGSMMSPGRSCLGTLLKAVNNLAQDDECHAVCTPFINLRKSATRVTTFPEVT